MCVSAFSVCMYIYHIGVWGLQRSEEGIEFPGTEVTGLQMVESQHGWWKYNLGSLEEKQVFLTTDPSPTPKFTCFSKVFIFFFFFNVGMGLHH